MLRIYALYNPGVGKNQLEFVGLQVTDEMPLGVGGHLHGLGGEFLGTVLAEGPLPEGVGLHQLGKGMEFGNCHKADALRQLT